MGSTTRTWFAAPVNGVELVLRAEVFSLDVAEHESSHLSPIRYPKGVRFRVLLGTTLATSEIEHGPRDVPKPDSLYRAEFAKPSGSGSHRLCGCVIEHPGGWLGRSWRPGCDLPEAPYRARNMSRTTAMAPELREGEPHRVESPALRSHPLGALPVYPGCG